MTGVAIATAEPAAAPLPRRGEVFRRYLHNPVSVAAAIVIVVLVVLALFAPWIAPKDPNAQTLVDRLHHPGHKYLLGADEFGRDQLSRLIYGARVSLTAAVEAVAIAFFGGVPLGLIAGYYGGWLDAVLGRANDAIMSVPFLLLAFTIVAVIGFGLGNAMLAVGIAFIPQFFRIARSSTQAVRQEDFIEATIALGATPRMTLWRHVLPNALSPLAVHTSVVLGVAVSAEASLSFLGLGAAPPTASWGAMLKSAMGFMDPAPFLVYAPGIMIAITVLCFTLVGDGLRQALGTRQISPAADG
jgi:ABC-type dipeptide/oligopeptide/nickel transport system permease subunit